MSRIASRRFIVLALLTTVLVGVMLSAERSSTAMTNAATRFLAGLSPEQRQKASFPFDTDEPFAWKHLVRDVMPLEPLVRVERKRGFLPLFGRQPGEEPSCRVRHRRR